MRVFAGPNGSGKSTMYKQVRSTKVNGRQIDLGIYINPDEIAKELATTHKLDLRSFEIRPERSALVHFGLGSGLIGKGFSGHQLRRGHTIRNGLFELIKPELADRFAQLITQFICHELIKAKKRFSFETVFSHESKLQLMRDANKAGFKVYLYFIATEDPEINIDRVDIRVKQGGHAVPAERITERYYRSLDLLPEAIELAYHAFIFDNSGDDPDRLPFGEYKVTPEFKSWWWQREAIPDWFIRAYLIKSGNPLLLEVARQALETRTRHM